MSIDRKLLGTILVPTLLVQAGTTMGNTFIPLYARGLGSSMAAAALVTALMFLGQAIADLPGGYLVHRFGDRTVMIGGMGMALSALILRMSVAKVEILVLSILIYGVGSSFIWNSRMYWLKHHVRGAERGRVMSLVGGALRMALLAGPLIGGFVAEHWGYTILFTTQAILISSALLFVVFRMPASLKAADSYHGAVKAAGTAWNGKKGTIAAAALGIGGLTVLRASREILFPLWGGEMGLGESLIGVVMFVGAVVDVSLFWMSGVIMTRLGRKTAAVACTTGLALAIALLPLANSLTALMALSVLAGIGNALGAGINLAVSGDLAPRDSPAFFLSVWRFIMGFAGFGGPALAAWMIGLAGSSAAPPVVGLAGLSGALVMMLFMKETRQK